MTSLSLQNSIGFGQRQLLLPAWKVSGEGAKSGAGTGDRQRSRDRTLRRPALCQPPVLWTQPWLHGTDPRAEDPVTFQVSLQPGLKQRSLAQPGTHGTS